MLNDDQLSAVVSHDGVGTTPVTVGTLCLEAAQRAANAIGGGVAIVVSEATGELVLAARHDSPVQLLEAALQHVNEKGAGGFAWSSQFVSRSLPASLFTHADADVVLTLASTGLDAIDIYDAVFMDLAARRKRYCEQR